MLHSKRTQIRRDLRQGQLQNLFMLRRKELVHGTIGLFRQLDAAIYAQPPAISDMELASSLVTCLHNHPEEENAYILVGNYLFHNNHQLGYFFSQLVDTPRYLENQMWCLRVMTSILNHQHQQQEQSQELIHDQLQQVMETACSVAREMSCNLKRFQFSTDKDLKLWFYFMEILKVQINVRLQLQFPHQAVSLLREVLALLPVQEETEYLQYTWWCLKAVLVRVKQARIKEQLFGVSWPIFWAVLKQLPQQREQCLQTMTSLLENHSISFMNIIFHEEIISELLYIFSQLPAHKNKIAYLLKLLVPMCSLDQTMLILNLGSHKVLTEAMEWAMHSYNNACLEDSLAALYFLLERLKDMHERQLTRRILSEVEALHFDQMLEGLSQHPQNSTVSKYLNLLIDDFYSDEVL